MRIFITGTDTNIGKTTIASWLCLHTKYDYWKPIQSCAGVDNSDTVTVRKLTSSITHKEIYIYNQPISPHLASRMANEVIELAKIKLPSSDNLIIEGAGGVLVPLNEDILMVDLIKYLKVPVIIVAKSAVGTINHTLLTLEALRLRDIEVLGVIMNGEENIENKKAIEYYGKTKVLFSFPRVAKIDKDSLKSISFSEQLNNLFV